MTEVGVDVVELVEVVLPDGQTMLARVHAADPVGSGPRDIGLSEALSFEGVSDTLEQIGRAVVGALVNVKPERARVEFGLELAVKSGRLTGLLVEGNANASLKVTLEWQASSPAPVASPPTAR
jgi:hypothetical protein